MITTEILHAYSPYGLQVMRPDGKTILPVDGVFGTLVMHKVNGDIEYSSMSGCKPILRPLSELKYEDWIAIAKIDGWFQDGEEYQCFHYGIKQGHWAITFNLDGFHVSIGGNPSRVTNQWQLWQYMFKQHYNVFNLPDGEYVKKV